jgi:hypothetical protein
MKQINYFEKVESFVNALNCLDLKQIKIMLVGVEFHAFVEERSQNFIMSCKVIIE